MFQSKLTKQQREEKLQKLLGARSQLERGIYQYNTPAYGVDTKTMIADWKTFINLPDKEREKRYEEWEAYYAAVQTGTQAQLFRELEKADKNNDRKRMKELAREAKKMRESGYQEFEKPKSADPFEMENSPIIQGYIRINKEIKELLRTVSAPVVDDDAVEAFGD